jgi:hypothetical protein
LLVTVPSTSFPTLAFGQARANAAPAAPAAPAQGGDLVARGRALFDDQKYEESIQVLSAALVRPINSREQKIEIYRLLAFNYVTLNRRDEAENAIRGLLVLDPDYALPKNESPRFRDVFTAVHDKWEAEGRPGYVVAPKPVAPVAIVHTPRAEAHSGDLLPIVVRLDDAGDRVHEVRVYYRTGSRGAFTELSAELTGKSARAMVPGPSVQPPFVDYYVSALDDGGLPIAGKGDAMAPLRVVVPESNNGWILPVVIGGSVLAIGAVFGGLALAGVFKSNPPTTPTPASRDATVSITIRE